MVTLQHSLWLLTFTKGVCFFIVILEVFKKIDTEGSGSVELDFHQVRVPLPFFFFALVCFWCSCAKCCSHSLLQWLTFAMV